MFLNKTATLARFKFDDSALTDCSRWPSNVCVGIDWGTTHRRVYVTDARGQLLHSHFDKEGLLAVQGSFETSLDTLLSGWRLAADTPVIMFGMVGSRSGWVEAPYCPTPTPLKQLATQLFSVSCAYSDVNIVPGVSDEVGPDVMRGEETQILGAVAMGAGDGCYLLPGTHSKWVWVEDGAIERIHTFMTGELFAQFRQSGTLASILGQNSDHSAAFAQGLAASEEGVALSRQIFGVRAHALLNDLQGDDALSYLSGLLIGAEWSDPAIRQMCKHGQVNIIGETSLVNLYAQAAHQHGVQLQRYDANQTCVAALHTLIQAREHLAH